MDPIHPIVPVVPDILPVLPSPRVGQVNRDAPRDSTDHRQRRDRPQAGGGAGDSPGQAAGEIPPVAEDDGGLGHVDITA